MPHATHFTRLERRTLPFARQRERWDSRMTVPEPGSSQTSKEQAGHAIPLTMTLEPDRAIAGRYRVDRLLTRSSTSRVYAGAQIPIDRPVAIKIFRAGLRIDAATFAKIVHRNIVGVLDYGELETGEQFLVTEYLAGEPLSALLAREKKISSERACRIAIQICRALRAAHAKGLSHQDLKTSNVIVLGDGDDNEEGEFIKLLDFGSGVSPDGVTSLGILLSEILGESRDVAPELLVIASRAKEDVPGDRYGSLDDLLADLKAAHRLIAGTPSIEASSTAPIAFSIASSMLAPRPRETTPRPVADPPRASSRKIGPLAILAVIVGIGGAGVMVGRMQKAPRAEAPANASALLPSLSGTVTLKVASTPPGAEVSIDGRVVGKTPFSTTMRREAQGARKTIVLRMNGYDEATAIADLDQDSASVQVNLVEKHARSSSHGSGPRPAVLAEEPDRENEAQAIGESAVN